MCKFFLSLFNMCIKKFISFFNNLPFVKRFNNMFIVKLFKKLPSRARVICSLVLTVGVLYLVSGFLFRFNYQIFSLGKKYENKLSFIEFDTNSKAQTNSAVARVGLKSDPSWYWPVEGDGCFISQYFHSGHKAIDIAGCGYGSNIHSAQDGVVVTAGNKSMNGNYIIILHDNGYHSMYAHLSQIYVSFNQRVTRGQIIGAMGGSGYSTGTHLDFSIWKNGYPYRGGSQQNPLNFY